MLRDELQAIDDPSAVRLATQIDVAATMLLAAPVGPKNSISLKS
jgi:hypothetical protein